MSLRNVLLVGIVAFSCLVFTACGDQENQETEPSPTPTVEIFPPTSTPLPPSPTQTPAPTETSPPAVTDTPVAPFVKVTASTLNVRDGPSTSAEILTRLQAGVERPATGRSAASDWVQISLSDGSSGWVSVEWVELSVPMAALPIIDVALPTATPAPPTPTTTTTLVPVVEATPTLLPAPALTEPDDGQTFDAFGPPRLAWNWAGALADDQYFVVTISFPHEETIWQDIQWTKESFLTPPAYLRGLIMGDRHCTWSVTVMRHTAMTDDGLKTGVAVSLPSRSRTFFWGN